MGKVSRFRKYMGQILSLNRDLKLIFVNHMLWTCGEGLYLFILPLYVLQLGGDASDLGFTVSVMYFVYMLALLLGGFLADRFDRKWLMLLTFLFATPSTLIYSFATEWRHLIPGIIMYSFVIGSPAENAYIAASTSEEKMARAFSVTEIGYPLGLIFSPFLGAYLVGIMDMRWLFRISFLISIISMLPLFFVSSQIPQRKEKTHKPLGEFLSPLRNKSFIILMPIFILIASSVTMMVTFLSPVLQDLHKLDSSFVLALGSVLSTGEVSLGILFGWIGDHWGAFIALSLSLIAVSASAFLLAFPLPFVLVAFTIFLMGAQRSAMALPRSIIGRCSSNISSGAMFGIYGAIMGITQTFVPVLAGMIYGFSPTQLFLFTGSISLAIIPLVFVTEKRFGALRKARVKEA